MKGTIHAAIVVVLALVSGATAADAQQERAQVRQWDFEDSREGNAPSGFSFTRTGSSRLGRWVVNTQPDAPSGTRVLAQIDSDQTDFRFPMAVADEPLLADLRLSVRCKPVSGNVDQACGLVFRYQDENSYYVTRANALEHNVRLYKVVKGKRQQFAGWNGSVTGGTWHELGVEAKGDHFTVSWDGQRVIDVHDQAFSRPGKVGLWTKADSITYFDDLRVEPRAAP